jgi:hypothetical protein
MFCGVLALLAGAMPREAFQRESSARALQPSGSPTARGET